jgi:CHAD domain-containing protein
MRETERKYQASDEVTLSNPAESLGLACAAVEEQALTAVYFDTADLRLLRVGITLRRREGGDDAGWHLKLPAGKDRRDELQLPLEAGRQPPAELVELTQAHTHGAPLEPVAELTTHRRVWRLADADGHEVANLVDDHVVAITMAEPQQTQTWREVEVELAAHGDPEMLDRAERWLLGLGARRSASPSKLSRLLADRLGPPSAPPSNPGDRHRSGSAGVVVLAYLRVQHEALRRYCPMVHQDAPDAVHQMRVAARRMHSGLQAFGRILDRDRTRSLTFELKWLAGELGEARDTEVMAQRFTGMLSQLPDEARLGPVHAQIDREFARRYAQARQRALTALASNRYRALLAAIEALLADPPLTERARRPAKRELPRSILRVCRRTSQAMAHAQALPPGQRRDVALHDARKAAKRLRYALEAAESAVGKPAVRLRKRLEPVQDLLGEHQDAVVARPVLRDLAMQSQREGGNGFTYGVLYAAENDRARRTERALPRAWNRLNQPKIITWLTS